MPTLASELDLPEISATAETFDQRFARKMALDPDQWLVRNMFGYAVLHYDDVTAMPARQAVAQRSQSHPGTDGHHQSRRSSSVSRSASSRRRATCTRGCDAWSLRHSRHEQPIVFDRSCAR